MFANRTLLVLLLCPAMLSAQTTSATAPSPVAAAVSSGASTTAPLLKPGRDPMQPIDSEYTKKIH